MVGCFIQSEKLTFQVIQRGTFWVNIRLSLLLPPPAKKGIFICYHCGYKQALFTLRSCTRPLAESTLDIIVTYTVYTTINKTRHKHAPVLWESLYDFLLIGIEEIRNDSEKATPPRTTVCCCGLYILVIVAESSNKPFRVVFSVTATGLEKNRFVSFVKLGDVRSY